MSLSVIAVSQQFHRHRILLRVERERERERIDETRGSYAKVSRLKMMIHKEGVEICSRQRRIFLGVRGRERDGETV